ncbi:unnamed protein product [Phaedon cochleariae]|uniref:Peptidase S1 domain-containing protein n=1 Tax=Phaedon cochleariae TaxID=80249 RepID=A0A9N9SN53_PHACE|nr:unnamed protein product [Phaedon cochleariae]
MNKLYFFLCISAGILHIVVTQENVTRTVVTQQNVTRASPIEKRVFKPEATPTCSDQNFNTKFYVGLQKPLRHHYCGGTLLNARWVLTSAQCQTNGLIAAVGINDVLDVDVWTEVARMFPYPHWNKKTNEHDIAIFELADPIQPNKVVEYVRLPDRLLASYEIEFEVCREPYFMGITYRDGESKRDRLLCEDALHIEPWDDCIEKYGSIHLNTLCVSSYFEEADVCRGDLGGPMMCEEVQYAVISSQRCKGDKPITFTRLDPYLGFIKVGMQRSASQKMYMNGMVFVLLLLYNTIIMIK